MARHFRSTPLIAIIGVLTLSGASAVRAQEPANAPARDSTATAQSDTSGYRVYQRQADSVPADSVPGGQGSVRSDTSSSSGQASDTTLEATPGAQTAPTQGVGTSGSTDSAARAGGVACKDGSNATKGDAGCAAHGGIDWAVTRAALKAREGMPGQADDAAAAGRSDSGAPASTRSR